MMTTTVSRQPYNRDDIILVLFPHSDLRTAKPRPALIVQADNLNTGLAQVIAAMITSRLTRANHPSRVAIHLNSSEGERSGLLSDSVIMTDNLVTIAYSEVDRRIGSFSMDQVEIALRYTFNL